MTTYRVVHSVEHEGFVAEVGEDVIVIDDAETLQEAEFLAAQLLDKMPA